jgi:hypothetical protein
MEQMASERGQQDKIMMQFQSGYSMNSCLGVTATTDMAVFLSELEALRAGSLASSDVGPCDVPFRCGSASISDFGFLTTNVDN